ncbi:MAG TPA: radical SAM protein [bacterium]|nr:radical SAM protein [bacterium]HQL61663.1 radical SAM protein [bacterium]
MQPNNNHIVLIRPPTGAPRLSFLSLQPPINLAYLAAAVRPANFQVEIWDYGMDPFSRDDLEMRAQRFRPGLVGISCLTPTIPFGYEIATAVKEISPDTKVVMGGSHSSALPQQTLEECPALDAVVVGEGEQTFLECAERVRSGNSLVGCAGLAHRQGGSLIVEPPRPLVSSLDELSFPARELLDHERYSKVQHSRGISEQFGPQTEIFTSRGCPGRCIFCAVNVNYGSRVRFRSVENVLAEVEECQRCFGIRHFIIQDDTFNLRESRVADLMRGFRKLGVPSFSCDARVDTVSREMLAEMARSGCRKISFGVESGSPRILALNGKGILRDQVVRAFAWAREVGIELLEATFMIGSHPDETEEDLRQTQDLIREIRPDILFCSVAVPYPGTELRNLLQQADCYPSEEHWEHFAMFTNTPVWRTFHFSPEELVRARDRALRSYYLTPRYLLGRLGKLRSGTEAKYWIRAGMDYLRATFRGR